MNKPSATRHPCRAVITRLLVVAALALLVTAPIPAQQPLASGPPTELARRATDRLRALHEEADSLAADERTVLGQLRRLELERQIRREEVRQADADVAAAVDAIAVTDHQIAKFVAERDTERPMLKARLIEIYKLGQGRYLRMLLSTPDVRLLGHASRAVAALAMSDRDRIARYERRLGELSAARQTQASRQQQLVVQRGAAAQAQVAAARALDEQNSLIREIDGKRDLNARLAGELQAAFQKLESTLKGVAGSGTAPALPIGSFLGALPWPVNGAVESRGAMTRSAEASGRAGVEIGAPEGSAVQAIHDGIVAYAGSFDGLGSLVILDHGAQTFSLYGNLLDMAVGGNVHVDRGQTIGRVGSPPTGPPGLYFELRVNGHPVDPLQWLGTNERR